MKDELVYDPFPFLSGEKYGDLEFPCTLEILLEYLKHYISSFEKHLEAKRSETIQRMNSSPEVHSFLEERLFVIGNIYPNLLRGSFWASIYTVLEDGLRSRCRCLQELKDAPFSADEVAGRGYLNRYKKYIERLIGVDISKIEHWSLLQRYGEIRNRVVHSRRRIRNPSSDLAGFVDQHPLLRLERREIVFERGACEAFIDVVLKFLESVDETLPQECRSPEPHFGFRP